MNVHDIVHDDIHDNVYDVQDYHDDELHGGDDILGDDVHNVHDVHYDDVCDVPDDVHGYNFHDDDANNDPEHFFLLRMLGGY